MSETRALTLDEAQDLIRDGMTPGDVAAQYGGEVVEGCYVPDGSPLYADDGNAEVEMVADTPRDAAQEYVDEGDWGDRSTTSWVNVYTYRKGVDTDGDIEHVERERRKITLEAEEPECLDDDGHDWQAPHKIVGGIRENPGVWGHGGGVIVNEVCLRCGCRKQTDTWAQDRSDGVQGLTAVEYQPRHYAEEVADYLRDQLRDDLPALDGDADAIEVAEEARRIWLQSVDPTDEDDQAEIEAFRTLTDAARIAAEYAEYGNRGRMSDAAQR